ncbi:ATPase family AAA domain-containing protein 2B-like [Schistocerca serialis cubense]|uniref:ATPase family AAA domain-containing protein 2B-like n=1 Tax=Schistocerca serialis cubense TaxID=2023355 RepID=UPI00214DF2C2|nr:ATPase family AAA domain-containing protein 2B-like [Schistocerca serialis cubense]
MLCIDVTLGNVGKDHVENIAHAKPAEAKQLANGHISHQTALQLGGPCLTGAAVRQLQMAVTLFEIKDKMLFCPRILLTGSADQGLTSHLAPAILHRLEHLPVHLFDVTTLCKYNNLTDCGCIEAIMSQRLETVRMQQPCIMYLPDITEWWNMAGDLVRSIFLRVMNCFDSRTEVLLLATAHVPYTELPDSVLLAVPCCMQSQYPCNGLSCLK